MWTSNEAQRETQCLIEQGNEAMQPRRFKWANKVSVSLSLSQKEIANIIESNSSLLRGICWSPSTPGIFGSFPCTCILVPKDSGFPPGLDLAEALLTVPFFNPSSSLWRSLVGGKDKAGWSWSWREDFDLWPTSEVSLNKAHEMWRKSGVSCH